MKGVEITRHATTRMQQRSISYSDIALILRHGENIDGGGILLDNKAADAAIRLLKSQIAAFDRLRNTKVVVAQGTVVTCYPCGPNEARRMKKAGAAQLKVS